MDWEPDADMDIDAELDAINSAQQVHNGPSRALPSSPSPTAAYRSYSSQTPSIYQAQSSTTRHIHNHSASQTLHSQVGFDDEVDASGYELPPVRPSQFRRVSPSFASRSLQDYSSSSGRTVPHRRQEYAESSVYVDKYEPSRAVQLVPVSSLPDMYRGVFKFGVFNAVQSTCFKTIMSSNKDLIVTAPTSSGKTVLFELALIKLLNETAQRGGDYADVKCVYMAPTKSLCTERVNDWNSKFQHLGVKCCEMTGDSELFGREAWKEARKSTIIVTTPEKWDSMTRDWNQHQAVLSQMALFLVDEVHTIHEPPRGSTLEVCISRMKARASTSTHGLRIILVSATVPNVEDLEGWLRYGGRKVALFKFDESYRPVRITRHVYGYSRKSGVNDFQFSATLDSKVFGVLEKHANNKPVVIFCATRKGVLGTATKIAKLYQELVDEKASTLPWKIPGRLPMSTIQDKDLPKLLSSGIGVHHGGLAAQDRHTVEDLFAKRQINVIVSTSTLAVGVNMPAHTVIILGTKQWAGTGWAEYSDLDIMQMIGRAGRPQFGTEGVAIIMCESSLEAKYQNLIAGKTILESCLHSHLLEHLASEIYLGMIKDMEGAKAWLRNTFLFQRIQKNPRHYAERLSNVTKAAHGVDTDEDEDDFEATSGAVVGSWEARMDQLVSQSIKTLRHADMVHDVDSVGAREDGFATTGYGETMVKYYVRLATMKLIMALPSTAGLRDILELISSAEECTETVRLRAEEKKPYNDLRTHYDIRYQPKAIKTSADKVFALIQASLGGISLNSKDWKTLGAQRMAESNVVLRHASRIAQAIVDVALVRKAGNVVKYGMELVRSLKARAWEDRPVVLRQIPQIGDKSFKVLAENGIATLHALRTAKPHHIDEFLKRKAPFGSNIVKAAQDLPEFIIGIQEEGVSSSKGKDPVVATILVTVQLQETSSAGKIPQKKVKGLGMTSIMVMTSDNDLEDFRRLPTKSLLAAREFSLSVALSKPSQAIIVSVHPDNFAGLSVSRTYKPCISPSEYPTINTRPKRTTDEFDDLGSEVFDISDSEMEDLTGAPPAASTSKAKIVPMKPPHKASQDLPTKSSHNASSSASRTTKSGTLFDALATKPVLRPQTERLSNGNYKCNHACKDKTKCRHICCREGLAKPPTNRKAVVKAKRMNEDSPPIKPKANTVKNSSRMERDLDDLNRMHSSSAAGSNPFGTVSKSFSSLKASKNIGASRRVVDLDEKPRITDSLTRNNATPSNHATKSPLTVNDDSSDDDEPDPDIVMNDILGPKTYRSSSPFTHPTSSSIKTQRKRNREDSSPAPFAENVKRSKMERDARFSSPNDSTRHNVFTSLDQPYRRTPLFLPSSPSLLVAQSEEHNLHAAPFSTSQYSSNAPNQNYATENNALRELGLDPTMYDLEMDNPRHSVLEWEPPALPSSSMLVPVSSSYFSTTPAGLNVSQSARLDEDASVGRWRTGETSICGGANSDFGHIAGELNFQAGSSREMNKEEAEGKAGRVEDDAVAELEAFFADFVDFE